MTPDRYQRIKEIFYAACQCEGEARAHLLDEKCGPDADLRTEVEALLHAEKPGGALLEQPVLEIGALESVVDPAIELAARNAALPKRVGPYRVIRLLGEGGMGTVYEAEQETPRRRVAVKVIRSAGMSPSLRRRFEHEIHLLGRLQHPGIAQIFEANTSEWPTDAPPFFAMELVDGQPLIDYADAHHLDIAQRLELMLKVCDAVQHAHQRGVIHRDLKPGNILVDRTGQPKVLDFGIARATDSDVQLTTMGADVGQIMGTMPYMSPEQITSAAGALDTRCDVYALGVVMYELLAGRLPYELEHKSVPDAMRIIRDEEPRRISTVNKVFRGDLETILLKALEKDREKRYQSAADLAADIRRFLTEQPIAARPPSMSYQLRKFARRNKAIVAGVVVAVIGLGVGTGAAVWKAYEATIERDHALRESRKASRINAFLQQVLGSADPALADSDVTVRETLDRAAASADVELADEPEVLAAVHHQLGQIYHRLTRFDDAERHLEIALRERRKLFGDDEEVAVTLCDLGWALQSKGDFEGSERKFEESLAIMRRVQGDGSPDVAVMHCYIADAKNTKHAYAEAEALARDSLKKLERLLGPKHENIAYAQTTLARSLLGQGKAVEAEPLYRRALAMQRDVLGPDHLQIAFTLTGLADCLAAQGRTHEEAAAREQAAAIRKKRVGRP